MVKMTKYGHILPETDEICNKMMLASLLAQLVSWMSTKFELKRLKTTTKIPVASHFILHNKRTKIYSNSIIQQRKKTWFSSFAEEQQWFERTTDWTTVSF